MNKYYCYNRNINYKDEIESIIQSRKKEIFSFFGITEDIELDINIYIYNSIEELVQGMKDRGFEDMPHYMCACQKDEDNSLNYFEPKDNDDKWTKEKYKDVIFHELVHAIEYKLYGIHPEWLTEGIAKYLDGTYSKGIKYLFENYIHKNRIPSMYELKYEFGEHENEYDSYDYAYIMVCYLIEVYGKDEFLRLISNKNELDIISQNLVLDSIDYYNNKYFNINTKKR